ncbi:hypothetical protein AAHA92_12222 [Salvia divinorum]|uniref:Uncharacterized protein n=1 Tax=Salvia divinorum TaxID=28513 RepID=A0ABD1HMU9_SALDI
MARHRSSSVDQPSTCSEESDRSRKGRQNEITLPPFAGQPLERRRAGVGCRQKLQRACFGNWSFSKIEYIFLKNHSLSLK